MEVIITKNYDEMSKKAAEVIKDVVKNDENSAVFSGVLPEGKGLHSLTGFVILHAVK